MSDRTFLCRCEDVTHAELEHALAAGLRTIEEIKRYTGFGTGPCQGKECLATVARELVRLGHGDARGPSSHAPARELRPFTARPPTEPVSFGALASVPDPFAEPESPA